MSSRKLAEQTTIAITTLDRPEFVERTLRFYKDNGFGGVIQIGDGSRGEKAAATVAVVDRFRDALRIDYISAPDMHQPATMKLMAERVTTDFAVYSGDDDWLIPSALDRCQRFLRANSEYASAHGHAVALNMDGPRGLPVSTDPYHLPTLSLDRPMGRLNRLFADYNVGMFNLHRADVWRQMFSRCDRMPDRSIGAEIAPTAVSAALGPSALLNILYLVRQIHETRYLLTSGTPAILRPEFVLSAQIMLDQLSELILEHDPEQSRPEERAYVPARVFSAWMNYVCHGFGPCGKTTPRRFARKNLGLNSLLSRASPYSRQFRSVLASLTGETSATAAKPAMLINWGNPYVIDEAITPILPALAEKFRIVLLLVDYNLTDKVRAKAQDWKRSRLVEDVLVLPSHGGSLDVHRMMANLTPIFRALDFRVFLSISAMQPYERYLLDWILPPTCLRLVMWPHPTNLFVHPQLAEAVIGGDRAAIDREIAHLRRKIQPGVLRELFRPSLTALRLALFLPFAIVFDRLKRSSLFCHLMGIVSRLKRPKDRLLPPDMDAQVADGNILLDAPLSSAPVYEFLATRISRQARKYLKDNWRETGDALVQIAWLCQSIVMFPLHLWKKVRNIDYKQYGFFRLILIGLDLDKLPKKFYQTADRYVFPALLAGRTIPFRRLDSLTQIGTDQFDACFFFNDGDTEAHKIFYDNPNFHTVAYVPAKTQAPENPVNAVLFPFSGHSERDMTPELIAIYRRDFAVALKESGAEEMHLRRHPGRSVTFLEGLVESINQGGVPCRLVGAERPFSEEAARYRGVLGGGSGALRDACLANPDIFVVGSIGLTQSEFKLPKKIIGFPERIGWIEADGGYDPAIFRPRAEGRMKKFPTIPEQIDRLLSGQWNKTPDRLASGVKS